MADLTQRLQLVVDATDSGSEATFRKITGAAKDTGEAAQRSAADVADAANRVLAAQAKQEDAAGQLRVAQQRLLDLQDKGNATAAQLAAAEEKVATAQRRVALASRDVEQALEQEGRAHVTTADATEKSSRAGEKMREQVTDLRNTVVGFVAGYSLADWATEAFQGFLNGARGANSLAISMNATVKEAGQLNTLMASVGLEADDLLEIQASFAQVVGANDKALGSFGATLQTNANGTTNWALTLEDALINLQKIPDATKRNQLGFQMFGEEGYKQLSRLLNSGVSVQEALERIGTPFDDDDVAAVQEYDQAMMAFQSTAGGLGRDLGRTLLPVVTGVVEAFGQFANIVGAIPAPIGLAVAASILLGLAQRSAAAEGGLLAGALAGVQGRVMGLRIAMAEAAVSTSLLGRGMGAARVAGGGLMGLLGGPAGIAVLGLGVGFELLNSLMGSNSEEAKKAESANDDLAAALKASNGVVNDSVRQQAALSAQESGLLGAAEKAGVARGRVTEALLGNKDAYNEVQQALQRYADAQASADNQGNASISETGEAALDAKGSLDELSNTVRTNATDQQQLATELGETTDKAALATAAMEDLASMIDAGTTSGSAFSAAVAAAAQAQDASTASSDRAKAAVDAYNATTARAVEVTLGLLDAQLSAANSGYAFLSAMDEAKAATDDHATSLNEVDQAYTRLQEAALGSAKSAADAAVESARASGTVLDAVTEAGIRSDAMLTDLRAKLDTPGLTDRARTDLQGMVDKLQEAKDKGDVQAQLTLTGVDQAAGELDATTEDRTATVQAESRGGPAVISYLDGIASARRLAIVQVESRGGPAVDSYLDGLRGRDRLAIVRVESRGGPAVGSYLDGLAHERLAIIRVETRGGPDVDRYLDSLASNGGAGRTAVIAVQQRGGAAGGRAPTGYAAPAAGLYGAGGDVNVAQLVVQVSADGSGRLTQQSLADAGRQYVTAISKYEQQNGTTWRRNT